MLFQWWKVYTSFRASCVCFKQSSQPFREGKELNSSNPESEHSKTSLSPQFPNTYGLSLNEEWKVNSGKDLTVLETCCCHQIQISLFLNTVHTLTSNIWYVFYVLQWINHVFIDLKRMYSVFINIYLQWFVKLRRYLTGRSAVRTFSCR